MQCALCKSSEKDDVLHGEFLRKGRVAVHYYCLLLTTVMEQNGDDNEGIRGFLVPDIIECAKKSENKKCTYCRDTGANIACCNRKCFRFFHTVCGAKNNARYIFYDTFQSFCHRHIDLLEDKNPHDPEELCTICCDALGTYHPLNSIRPPCCSSGWFHRLCLARAALSAGYFFRCPLCNDEKMFRNFLTHRNVFIPDRDASWELAPRAFSELERKISCTAPVCLCPTGRETNTNHWKMRICIVCGSKAIHMNCNKLYAHRRFTCDDCDFTLHEIERNKCMEATNGIGEINLEVRSETDEIGGQVNGNPDTAESPTNTAPNMEHNDELMGRVLRSRTRSLDVEKTDFEGIKKEDKKTHESIPIASTSTQAGPSSISPRKRTRSMFDNNNQPESKVSSALEVFHLHESHQSPPRKRTRSNTKGTVEPRRRSQRLAVQYCSTIVEEEEKDTPISIVIKDSATDDHQGNNYEAHSESVIQPTSSTPILNSVFTDKSSKSETFSDANQNETSIDLPKLALRKRANAVSHETFEDCDSFASEEPASDTHILEESSVENNMRCSQRKSQQFSNEELPTIAEEPNEDENVEREAIIEKEQDFESFSEDQGDQGDRTPLDESNSASNVDPEESVNTSTTSTATLHSIRSAKTPDSSNNNKRANRLKRPRTKRRRLVYAESSTDSYETDNSKDESFEISSSERILRPRSNKTKKNQRRRSLRLLKPQSPIREETDDQTTNNSSHSNENGETGNEENASSSNSFETTSNSTTTLNSTCFRMTPDNDGRQPLKTAKARTKYLSESQASKSPKLCLRNRTHSMFSGLQVDHSIPLEDLKVDEGDTTLERTFTRPNKKSEDIMERDIFTERRRRSYRLEKQQTPIITQKLPTVALTEPDMRVLNNRNRPCRKAALYSRIRTFKMCDYFNSKCD